MPAPPLKKRRVVVEISDDDDLEEELSLVPLSSSALQRRRTRAPIRGTARSSVASAVNDTVPSKPSPSQSGSNGKTTTAAANAAPLEPKANNNTVAKPKSTTTTTTATTTRKSTASLRKKAPPEDKPIYSFFAPTQRPPSSSSQNSRVNLPSASQNEDFRDLIEDRFSDDASEGSSAVPVGARTRTSSLGGAGRFKVGGGGAMEKGRMESGGAGSVKMASKVRIVDPRPWPERFAPQSPNMLAVNQRKVTEVRSWFERVFDGFSKQRLLILKGSAGSGKTAVLEVLSKEMGFEVLEWKNPSGIIPTAEPGGGGGGGASSSGLTCVFEEFMGRAGRFGSLSMASTAPSAGSGAGGMKPTNGGSLLEIDGSKKKVILIEDFPNALFTSSPAPLASFRHTIKSFLALPPPSRLSTPVPPVVLIISESANMSGSNAFTAHRLLSPEILHHPLATSITFNKIAPTFMTRALSAIIAQESRESGRRFGPSSPMLQALSSSGDIRSAIMGLEFLAVNGELGAFSEKVNFNGRVGRKRASGESDLNEVEREILNTVTQRESSLGLFHAVGRVVYNKRYGDDAEDPYMPPPPKPPLSHMPYRARTSRVDLDRLMDEAGTSPQTFISGLHENYLGSCNLLGGLSRSDCSMEDALTCAVHCIESLSDSDLLASPKPYHRILGRLCGSEGGEAAMGSAGVRQDEISFQTAVRGVLLGLPTPVKRENRDTKMYYPTSLRLWRDQEEVEGLIDLFVKRIRNDSDCGGIGGDGAVGTNRTELTMERMPYSKIILKARQRRNATAGSFNGRVFEISDKPAGAGALKELDKVTDLKGLVPPRGESLPSHDDGDDVARGAPPGELEAAEERDKLPSRRYDAAWNYRQKGVCEEQDTATRVESLVLSDDDIEDD